MFGQLLCLAYTIIDLYNPILFEPKKMKIFNAVKNAEIDCVGHVEANGYYGIKHIYEAKLKHNVGYTIFVYETIGNEYNASIFETKTNKPVLSSYYNKQSKFLKDKVLLAYSDSQNK